MTDVAASPLSPLSPASLPLAPPPTSSSSPSPPSLAEIIRIAYETNALHARTSSGPPPIDITALLTNIALATATPIPQPLPPSPLPSPPPPPSNPTPTLPPSSTPELLDEFHRFLQLRRSRPPSPPLPSLTPSSPPSKKRKRYPVHNCLAEGTLVTLANGLSVPIQQVQVGAEVLSYHAALGPGEMEGLVVRQVDAVLDQGVKECVELLFSDKRTLVCTPDHRLRTADGRWVEAKDLLVGTDEVAVGVDYPNATAASEGHEQDTDVRQSVSKVTDGVHRDAKVLPLSRVQLVERREVGVRHVYDLSVPSPQEDVGRSFLANGVVVHNCGVCLLPCIPFPSSARYVTCCVCSISVHIECYGISKMSKAHSRQLRRRWKCEKCKEDETTAAAPSSLPYPSPPHPTSASCMYCPSTSFALKKATNGEWVHVVCALFLPSLALTLHHQHYGSTLPLPSFLPLSAKKKHRSFHLVTGVNSIPVEQYDLGCDVCGVERGMCVQCMEVGCRVSYHVTCAMMKGWCVRVEEVSEGGGNEVEMNTWCGAHTPDDWEMREDGGGRYVLEGRGVRKVEDGEVIDLADGEWEEDDDDGDGDQSSAKKEQQR